VTREIFDTFTVILNTLLCYYKFIFNMCIYVYSICVCMNFNESPIILYRDLLDEPTIQRLMEGRDIEGENHTKGGKVHF